MPRAASMPSARRALAAATPPRHAAAATSRLAAGTLTDALPNTTKGRVRASSRLWRGRPCQLGWLPCMPSSSAGVVVGGVSRWHGGCNHGGGRMMLLCRKHDTAGGQGRHAGAGGTRGRAGARPACPWRAGCDGAQEYHAPYFLQKWPWQAAFGPLELQVLIGLGTICFGIGLRKGGPQNLQFLPLGAP